MSTVKISIDGTILDEAAAKISVLDRGFLYGDSIYEVIRTYEGRPFALAEHLDRLRRSAELLDIVLPISQQELASEIQATLAAAGNSEFYIRLIVTRGSGPINLDPHTAKNPCRVIIVTPLTPLPEHLYREGVSICLVPGGRHSGGAVSLSAKSGNYLVNLMALGTARRQGAHEAVLLDSRGRVAEGATSNIFALFKRRLCTPHLSVGILEGITRHKVIELAQEMGLDIEESELLPADMQSADEIFLTGTLREVLPVTAVDDWTVGSGSPGPVTLELLDRFRRLTREATGSSDCL